MKAIRTIAAACLIAVAGASVAADTTGAYVTDGSTADVVKSGFGLCWHTSSWTPALAAKSEHVGKCDPDLAPKAAPKAAATDAKIALSADMLFAFNSAKLSGHGAQTLDAVVAKLAGANIESVKTVGYTDRIGSDKYNLALSQKRADAVKAYLASKGIDASRISAEGRGAADPVVNCANPSKKGEIKTKDDLIFCLAPNRRAVVDVKGTRAAK